MGWNRRSKIDDSADTFDERVYPDIMVDIETLGTSTNTVVLSIGAIRFRMGVQDDVTTILDPKRAFYARLDDDEQRMRGRGINFDTTEWWSRQSVAAQSVLDETGEPVAGVLKRFTKFCKGSKRIWGNGNMFDNAIIRNLYEDYDQDYPVGYWRDLDVRTLTWLWNFLTNWRSKGKRPEFKFGEEHNALDDARRQVLQVQTMLTELQGSKYES